MQPRHVPSVAWQHFFGSAVPRAESKELDEAYGLGYQTGHQAVAEQQGSAMQPENRQTDRCSSDRKQKRGESVTPTVKERRNTAYSLGYQTGQEHGLQD